MLITDNTEYEIICSSIKILLSTYAISLIRNEIK